MPAADFGLCTFFCVPNSGHRSRFMRRMQPKEIFDGKSGWIVITAHGPRYDNIQTVDMDSGVIKN